MRGQARNRIMRLCRSAVLLALLCILSIVSVFWGAVPFSLSLLGVLFVGCFLPPLDAFAALCAYLVLGGIGLPIFAGMRGGMDVLLGPTGGFLIAYPFMGGGMSLFLDRFCTMRKQKFSYVLAVSVLALLLCYLCGGLWYTFLYANADLVRGFAIAVLPFVLPDICKVILVAWLSVRLRHIMH